MLALAAPACLEALCWHQQLGGSEAWEALEKGGRAAGSNRALCPPLATCRHEPLVNAAWAQLRRAGVLPAGLSLLRRQLGAPSDSDRYQAAREQLRQAAAETLEYLRKRNDKRAAEAPPAEGPAAVSVSESTLEGAAAPAADAIPTARMLLGALLRVLARRPVRRYQIYDVWVRSWIAGNSAKAAGQAGAGSFAPRQVAVEAAAVSRALAVAMTCENVTRVDATQSGSRLEGQLTTGAVTSPFSSFLADDPLLKVAKAAAPLQARGGTLCFVHKTIQEFETASGVLAVIDKAFSALPIPPHKALELLEQLEDRARESPGGRSVLHPVLQSTAARPVRRLLLLFAESPLSLMQLVIDGKVIEEQVRTRILDPFSIAPLDSYAADCIRLHAGD